MYESVRFAIDTSHQAVPFFQDAITGQPVPCWPAIDKFRFNAAQVFAPVPFDCIAFRCPGGLRNPGEIGQLPIVPELCVDAGQLGQGGTNIIDWIGILTGCSCC